VIAIGGAGHKTRPGLAVQKNYAVLTALGRIELKSPIKNLDSVRERA
jgi:hypothetical protein